jgi:hypothetical protein
MSRPEWLACPITTTVSYTTNGRTTKRKAAMKPVVIPTLLSVRGALRVNNFALHA